MHHGHTPQWYRLSRPSVQPASRMGTVGTHGHGCHGCAMAHWVILGVRVKQPVLLWLLCTAQASLLAGTAIGCLSCGSHTFACIQCGAHHVGQILCAWHRSHAGQILCVWHGSQVCGMGPMWGIPCDPVWGIPCGANPMCVAWVPCMTYHVG